MNRSPRLLVRTATAADLPRLHAIAARAVHELLTGQFYTAEQMRAAAAMRIYEVEPELVEAGTYYVAEIDGAIVAGCGWSAGGSMQPTPSEHRVDRATVAMRAAYVDPEWARRGLASLLVGAAETAARIAGFRRFEALCTPPSEAMLRGLGYLPVGREEATLANGVTATVAHMRKVAA